MKLLYKTFYSLFVLEFSIAQIVKNIEISGNKRIPDETIIMFSSVNVNDEINDNKLNEILKDLYDSSFFENVTVNFTDNNLKISVVEFPIIDEIIYKGIKAKKIQEQIKNNLTLKPRSSFNKIVFLDDQKKILSTLKQLGYYFSTLESYIEKLDENRVNIINEINLGEKAKIKKISFRKQSI